MKTKLIGIALLIASPAAWSAEEPKNEGELIAAQVSVTRDSLNQVLKKMEMAGEEVKASGMSHPDFIAKTKAFNVEVEAAMLKFEARLAEEILKPASLWADRMRAVGRSQAYSAPQKEALLNDLQAQAKEAFKPIQAAYESALWDLLYVGLPKLVLKSTKIDLQTETCNSRDYSINISFKRCPKAMEISAQVVSRDPRIGMEPFSPETITWDNRSSLSRYFEKGESAVREQFDGEKIYVYKADTYSSVTQAIYERFLKRGCYSSACVSLFAGHLGSYLSLVHSSLNKELQFKVPTGTLTLAPTYFNPTAALSFFNTAPLAKSNLRFDLPDNQYRPSVTADVSAVFLDRTLDFRGGCPSAVSQPLAILCHSTEGCLNESERSEIVARIQGANLRDSQKTARIACLGTGR